MANINKKQASIAVLAVVFATAMFVSVIATDNAFANRNHRHHHHDNNDNGISQSISQSNSANQRSTIVTAGAFSDVDDSGNNVALQGNANFGGNAAVRQ